MRHVGQSDVAEGFAGLQLDEQAAQVLAEGVRIQRHDRGRARTVVQTRGTIGFGIDQEYGFLARASLGEFGEMSEFVQVGQSHFDLGPGKPERVGQCQQQGALVNRFWRLIFASRGCAGQTFLGNGGI